MTEEIFKKGQDIHNMELLLSPESSFACQNKSFLCSPLVLSNYAFLMGFYHDKFKLDRLIFRGPALKIWPSFFGVM